MDIGYRRAAMKLPLTANEHGARGTWLEKRLALIDGMAKRGHTVHLLSDPTQTSATAGYKRAPTNECETLIVEFAGMNMQFYGAAWNETADTVRAHAGPVIFLCDDPDMPFKWELMGHDEDWTRWTIAVNAVHPATAARVLHVPRGAEVIDTPFASLLRPATFMDGADERAIYIGRGNGRKKLIEQYIDSGHVVVAGNPKEWPGHAVLPQPEQSFRRNFYRLFRAAFAACDNKHIETGWRTGRAYHALSAGIPVMTPETPGGMANEGLKWAWQVDSPADVYRCLTMSASDRKRAWEEQMVRAQATFPWEALRL